MRQSSGNRGAPKDLLPPEAFDYAVLNDGPLPRKLQARYVEQGAEPVRPHFTAAAGRPLVITTDLLESGPVVRHSPDKLGRVLCRLAASREPGWLGPDSIGKNGDEMTASGLASIDR